MQKTDVIVSGGGTIYLFELRTPGARRWMEEHVSDERQMLGGAMGVEHRFVRDLLAGTVEDGLTIGFEDWSL